MQQNFHKTDTYMPPENQMVTCWRSPLYLYEEAKKLTQKSILLNQLVATGVFSALYRMKFDLGDGQTKQHFITLIDEAIAQVLAGNE